MLKVVGLSGSPRHGATEAVIQAGLQLMAKYPGVETDYISLAGKQIRPCEGCDYCKKNHCDCIFRDDMPALTERFLQADAYLIGTPVYVHAITPQLMAFFSRLRPVSALTPERLCSKLGAAVAVGGTRNGGEEAADTILIHMMMSRGMNIVSGESRGYIGGKVWSQDKKELCREDDALGMETVLGLSRKLVETALIYQRGKLLSAANQ
ncbi:MAG: flavodoxin family protein [Oscillospiraceae bacterium]|nr:flavodoxin family protein [Oscillospiraceae bacterium]